MFLDVFTLAGFFGAFVFLCILLYFCKTQGCGA